MDVLARTERPTLVQWAVDTRSLWPEATQTRQLAIVAARALGVLLTDDERAAVLRYYHVRDAKMALASHLLKHLAVARCAGVAWAQTALERDAHGKPVFRDRATAEQPVVFNVSHQAGLVVLAAVYGGGRSGSGRGSDSICGGKTGSHKKDDIEAQTTFGIGVDIVSPGERRARDHQMVMTNQSGSDSGGAGGGWSSFVDMHADVLAPGEVHFLKSEHILGRSAAAAASPIAPAPVTKPASAWSSDSDADSEQLDHRLRYFYALWCLREAYVKMTGEALLAPWLKELEFCHFRPPPPAPPPLSSPPPPPTDLQQDPAATVTQHDIRFQGRVVDDVNLCLRALGDDFMVCTAVRSPAQPGLALALEMGPVAFLDMEAIIAFAEERL